MRGLNYHLLPPYHHPEFEILREAAVEAIAASQVPVQADPAMWGQPIFAGTLERRIIEHPPAVMSREQALRDHALRRGTAHLYEQPKAAVHGQPAADEAFSKVRWAAGRLEVVTPESDGAYAASVDIADTTAGSNRRLKVTFDADCKSGVLGFGLLDVHKDVWLDRVGVPANTSTRIALETELSGRPIRLMVMNGGSDCVAAQGSAGHLHIEPESTGPFPVDWTRSVACNSADPLDDGTNPLGREARFACKAAYYSLYINELFFRVNPCCYLQRVPGYDEIRLTAPDQFVHAWNSPGMVALRRHLRDGPLYGACMRCPAKW